MSRTKEDLETRIKELEDLVGHYKHILDEKQSQIVDLKNELLAEKIKNIPVFVECPHDWEYNFNTTAPHRYCKRCFRYEPQFWWNNGITNTTGIATTPRNFPVVVTGIA